MRIAVVTPVFPTSAEPYRGIYVYETVRALQRHAEIKVFCTHSQFPRSRMLQPRSLRYREIDPLYRPSSVDVAYVTYPVFPVISRPLNSSICASRLLDPIRQFDPDLILSYWVYPEGKSACEVGLKLKVPVVVGALGSDLRRIGDRITLHLVKKTLRQASAVLTVSSELRERAIRLGAPMNRTIAILNGCDSSTFKAQDRNQARSAFGIELDAEVIVFVGWLAPLKGLPELMVAFEALAAERPKARLVVIGEGEMQAKIQSWSQCAALTGKVIHLANQTHSEIARWLAASNLLTLPSHSEGCPNVVIEALACGRPVVASNVGGIPELLDSNCGVLVPPATPSALAAALATALDHRWDEARIASHYRRSWHDVAADTAAVCKAVVNRERLPLHNANQDRSPKGVRGSGRVRSGSIARLSRNAR